MIWCPPILVDTSCLRAPYFRRCVEIRAYILIAPRSAGQSGILSAASWLRVRRHYIRVAVPAASLRVAGWPAGSSAASLALSHRPGGLAEIVRSPEVGNNSEITIGVPLDQIDDVLKSLIVRDDQGQVKNLSLAGPNPLEETFRTLRIPPAWTALRVFGDTVILRA